MNSTILTILQPRNRLANPPNDTENIPTKINIKKKKVDNNNSVLNIKNT